MCISTPACPNLTEHSCQACSSFPILEENSRSHLQVSPLSQPPHLVTMSHIFLHIPTISIIFCLNCSKSQEMVPRIQSLSLLTSNIPYTLLQSNPSNYGSYGITPLENETQIPYHVIQAPNKWSHLLSHLLMNPPLQ